MHAAEVEKGHVQMNRGGQMFERLAETETQSRKAAKVCPHAQIGAFDMASADSFGLRVSADADWDGRSYFRGVVPLRAFTVRRSVELEQLREVNVGSKRFFDGGNVTAESVCRDLESADNALAQILDEVVRAGTFTLCDQIGQDHFCFAVDCHPNVLVSPFLRSVAIEMGLFGMHERPQFVGLNEARADIPHASIEKASALLSYREKQRKNRALVCASEARDGANAHSFKQESDDLRGSLCRNVVASERFLAGFREGTFAGGATESLNLSASVGSKSVCFGVFAADTCHVGFSLVFLREKPDNHDLGSECGLPPRLDSALPSARTDGRALCYSFLPCEMFPVLPAREPANPAVGRNILDCYGLYFAVTHALQSSGHRRQRIRRVIGEIKIGFKKPVSNLCGSECSLWLRRNNTDYRLFQSDGSFFLVIIKFIDFGDEKCPFVVRKHVYGRMDELLQFGDFYFEFALLSQFCRELCDCFIQDSLVIGIIHYRQEYRHVYNKCQGESASHYEVG
jgi:hypothetical protein